MGKWNLKLNDDLSYIEDADGVMLAEIPTYMDPEGEACARLMAAAPDLYAALLDLTVFVAAALDEESDAQTQASALRMVQFVALKQAQTVLKQTGLLALLHRRHNRMSEPEWWITATPAEREAWALRVEYDALKAENGHLRNACEQAILQIEYLHEKFQETGNQVLAALRAALAAAGKGTEDATH